jgi:NAD(P)-dependent dehydrogenase (short-subunit alcohol dehydrogenase family)
MFSSFPQGGQAAVFGASGGLGAALMQLAKASPSFAQVSSFARPAFELTDERSIASAAAALEAAQLPLRLVVIATGYLHGEKGQPEKSVRQLDADAIAHNFAINATGPALLMKHLLPLMAREGRAAFVVISAKVASIADNRLGGWHSYRASKAALNMFVKTAAIEMARTRPDLILASLHPGTVETRLSAPFSKSGLDVRPPEIAASDVASVIDGLSPAQSGGFFNHKGETLPW